MADLTIPMSSAMTNLTLSVRLTGQRRAAVRLWLGTRLMQLAARVMGCGIVIDASEATGTSMAGPGAVPARYDVNAPDFDWRVGRCLRVMLDGVELTDVVAYDIAAGTVTRHVHDAAGRVVIDPGTDRLRVETVTGEVAVVWLPDQAAAGVVAD